MAFGNDIGGFKYVDPKNLRGSSEELLDNTSGQYHNYTGSSLDNSWTRRITGVTRLATQAELSRLSKVLEECLPEGITASAIPDKWKELRVKLEELYLENRDLGKSIDRGKRDILKFRAPGTEFFNKIRSELLEPLKDYFINESSVPEGNKEHIKKMLHAADLSLYTAYTPMQKR